jgi:hypothetical protein
MRITSVYADTAAAVGGLRDGDALRSVNGDLTERRRTLAWIIGPRASDQNARLRSADEHTAKDGKHEYDQALPNWRVFELTQNEGQPRRRDLPSLRGIRSVGR